MRTEKIQFVILSAEKCFKNQCKLTVLVNIKNLSMLIYFLLFLVVGVQQPKRTRKLLSDEQKYAAYVAMHFLCMSNGGRFKRDDKKKIAEFFGVGIRAIQRIWQTAMTQIENGLPVDVSNNRKGRCGRKAVDINLAMIPTIPLNKRSTIRSLSWQLGCSPTTLFRKFLSQEIKRVTNTVKPALTEKHMLNRVKFCLSMLDETTTASGKPWFINMHRIVHIDEKFFNMSKVNRNYYLLPDEEQPTRTSTNKNSIGKVMFLTAVARPRFDSAGNETFSGNIGCWPFVQEVPAARKSDNRPKGTLET